jgi:hypothetical protein
VNYEVDEYVGVMFSKKWPEIIFFCSHFHMHRNPYLTNLWENDFSYTR